MSLIVFLIAQLTDPENIRFLALEYNQFPQRWYSIITYGFVHVEWYHILINISILIFIGSWVEKLLGQNKYLILLLLSILAGGLWVSQFLLLYLAGYLL
ncbi:rhomboid family intramembrane serine protease [Natronospora cellulosivora (SeqCode)]